MIALTLGAAALRFATLNVQSIWLDESATMVLVRRGFSGMLSHLSSSESAPPLYYILVWAWTKLFGAGPLGFRPAGVRRSETYAVSRFLAPHATSVTVATLRRISGEPEAEVIVQR